MARKYVSIMSLLLLFIVSSFLQANERSDLQITFLNCREIETNFESVSEKCRSKACITLSDGSEWIVTNQDGKEILNEIIDNWRSGDEIRIGREDFLDHQEKYFLKNVRNGEVYLSDLDVSSLDKIKRYSIEKIDRNGYILFTQDGSAWAMGWLGSFSASSWRKGDRIIINKSDYSREEDYLLINADEQDSVWACLVNWK